MKLRINQKLLLVLAAMCLSQSLSAGNQAFWVDTIGSSGTDDVKAIAVGAEGAVYSAGNFTAPFEGFSPQGLTDVFLRKLDAEGAVVWTKTFPGSAWEMITDIAYDPLLDRLYVLINHKGSLDADPDAANSRHISNNGYTNSVLIALSSDGDYLWEKRFKQAVLARIAVQNGASNIYLCGALGSDSTFQYASLNHNEYTIPGAPGFAINGNPATFVASYDASGSYNWHYVYDLEGKSLLPVDIEVSDTGDVFVLGNGISLSDGSNWYSSDITREPFLIRLNNGNHQWTRSGTAAIAPGMASPAVSALALDGSQNVYVAGVSNADYAAGTIYTVVAELSGGDVFVSKLLQSSGEREWMYTAPVDGDHTGIYDIAVDATGVTVVGEFNGLVSFDPSSEGQYYGQGDAFLLKLSNAAAFQGVFALGGSGSDRAQRVLIDSGRLLVAGYFESGFDANPFGAPQLNISSLGQQDGFLASYQFTAPEYVLFALYHPADTNHDYRIGIDEITAFGRAVQNDEAWPPPRLFVDFETLVKGVQLWKNGEVYRKVSHDLPSGWELAPE